MFDINLAQREVLKSGINALNLESINHPIIIDNEQFEKINIYLDELQKWNKVYNLSGFKNTTDHIYRNIIDCLAAAPFIKGQNLMDLGTGAGLPGLLFAILNSKQHWVLLDGNGKKTRFLNQIKQLLSLDNVEVIHARAEDYKPQDLFDGISSRAFDKLPQSIKLCKHLFDRHACFYALKGKTDKQETEGLPSWARLEKVHTLFVPTIKEQRHLMIVDIHRNI